MGDLTGNLSRHEFACKCGCGFDTADVELVQIIQEVCFFFESSVIINSGCRCASHNKNEGGGVNSQHLKGRAADCVFIKALPIEVYEYLTEQYPDKLGIGLYSSFIHIDTRTGCARWDG